MLIRVTNTKFAVLCCALLLTAFSVSNVNAQNRAQPIDWGSVLDLSPKNTETRLERTNVTKELELGRQIREQNDRAQARLEGRQDSRGASQGAAVSSPRIETRGVFERDKPDRGDRPDRQEVQQRNVPQARPDLVGSSQYYNARRIDLYWNRPGASDPYYGRAARFYELFVNQVAPTLTPAGKAFVAKVGPALQQKIEAEIRRDPAGFARRERDPMAFGRFMARVHTEAYYENGFGDLPFSDKARLGWAIGPREMFSRDGRITTRDLIPGVFGHTPPPYQRAPGQINSCNCQRWRRY